MTKLIVAFRNFADAHKMFVIFIIVVYGRSRCNTILRSHFNNITYTVVHSFLNIAVHSVSMA
jgi:hypothetical protein